jgi:hypothetical protein
LDLLEELAEGVGHGGTVTSSQVRIKASWSLANMLDIDALPQCLSLQRLVRLCSSMLRMVAPSTGTSRNMPPLNPKVTPNAMRAIGNISRWLPLDKMDNGAAFPKLLLFYASFYAEPPVLTSPASFSPLQATVWRAFGTGSPPHSFRS